TTTTNLDLGQPRWARPRPPPADHPAADTQPDHHRELAIFHYETAGAIDWVDNPDPRAGPRRGAERLSLLFGTQRVVGECGGEVAQDKFLRGAVGLGANAGGRVRGGRPRVVGRPHGVAGLSGRGPGGPQVFWRGPFSRCP